MKDRYRTEGGRPCIDVRMHNWKQLFDSRDPAPFRDRDLDDDAAAYVFEAFEELGRHDGAKLVLHLAEGRAASLEPEAFRDAVHAHYENEQQLVRGRMRRVFRQARRALVIGVSFLALCTLLAHNLPSHTEGVAPAFAREGLTIFGWVALWRPIDLLLYSWWPLADQLEALAKLTRIPVEVRYDA